MPDDIIESNVPPPPMRIENEPVRSRKIVCEFCESELGPSGEYKRLSDKAKKFRDLEEKNDQLEMELTSARREITDLKTRLTASNPPANSQARRGGILV